MTAMTRFLTMADGYRIGPGWCASVLHESCFRRSTLISVDHLGTGPHRLDTARTPGSMSLGTVSRLS